MTDQLEEIEAEWSEAQCWNDSDRTFHKVLSLARQHQEALEQREAFLRAVDEDSDETPFDLADECRRLMLALDALADDDLLLAATILYNTQPRIAQEFLKRKRAAEPTVSAANVDSS